MSDSIVSLRHVEKWYGNNHVVKDMNLEIQEGEFLTLLGPSGCGKTTTLRMIAGFENATSGTIEVQGQRVEEKEPYERDVNTVFQNYSLFPHMTVFDNVAYGPSIRKVPKDEIKRRVTEMLALVQMSGYEKRKPDALSGGQKQRVAIARALATNPRYLLCDEATSALDPNTTRQILDLLKEINEKLGVTIIVITHEMKVIDRICDSVAVIDSSHIAEVGKVSEVFTSPKSKIARDLIIPKDSTAIATEGGRRIRLTFDGSEKTNEPLIARMVMECGAPENILFADTRIYEGVLHGHMVIELPNEPREADKIITWLTHSDVSWKEEI